MIFVYICAILCIMRNRTGLIVFKMEPVGFQIPHGPAVVEVPVRPVLQVDERWGQPGAILFLVGKRMGKG